MNLSCKDRERIFADGTVEEWTVLEVHANNCVECAGELRAWKALSSAAEELRDYRESPGLWMRIEASLIEEEQKKWWESILFWRHIPMAWQLGFVSVLVLAMAVTAGYVFMKRATPTQTAKGSFLKDKKLAEVERTEREYMKAIDKLAADAKPQMESSTSPLMASYQEKLVVLDSAIDELRLQAGQNPSNAHLRYQLLAMYQAKEATLQEILETKR